MLTKWQSQGVSILDVTVLKVCSVTRISLIICSELMKKKSLTVPGLSTLPKVPMSWASTAAKKRPSSDPGDVALMPSPYFAKRIRLDKTKSSSAPAQAKPEAPGTHTNGLSVRQLRAYPDCQAMLQRPRAREPMRAVQGMATLHSSLPHSAPPTDIPSRASPRRASKGPTWNQMRGDHSVPPTPQALEIYQVPNRATQRKTPQARPAAAQGFMPQMRPRALSLALGARPQTKADGNGQTRSVATQKNA